jgi:hypothetical protein
MAKKKEWVKVENTFIEEVGENLMCTGLEEGDPEVYFPKSCSKISKDGSVSVEKWFLDEGI